MKRYIAEALGTFCLVFAGTGAIVVDQAHGGVITHIGVAVTFGLIVMAMIYAIGDVSGAHINPAVTVAFSVAGRFPAQRVLPYIVSQVAGGLAASVLLLSMFPEHPDLGATLPSGDAAPAFVFEVVLTFMLMFQILNVSTGAREKGITAGLAVGGMVALEAMFAGPVSGASMNPARSIAPAVVSGNLQHLWIYVVAPVLGALIAIPAYHSIRADPADAAERDASDED